MNKKIMRKIQIINLFNFNKDKQSNLIIPLIIKMIMMIKHLVIY